jgi:hypothetical protein
MRLIAALLIIGVVGAARAEERRLNAEEIAAALTGNTARGVEPGPEFLQFFDANGTTTYVTKSGPPDHGRWRTDAGGLYCSSWRDSGWSCYEVWGEGDAIVWVAPATGTRYPARMLPGRVGSF